MLQIITGYWVTQVVRTAAELHIADHLHPAGATAAEVAEAQSLDPQATFRFLRACASVGLASARTVSGSPPRRCCGRCVPVRPARCATWRCTAEPPPTGRPGGTCPRPYARALRRRRPLSAPRSSTGSPGTRRRPESPLPPCPR
ncbi:methyltransferase dimerization domain-containing protein [Streptomyces sp. NPDC127039]|uniref:methyltransferase family protein n=1 Tax=Streptomyces sp. NPDC127039 TaxID=3347115 RepID=UPI00365124B0